MAGIAVIIESSLLVHQDRVGTSPVIRTIQYDQIEAQN